MNQILNVPRIGLTMRWAVNRVIPRQIVKVQVAVATDFDETFSLKISIFLKLLMLAQNLQKLINAFSPSHPLILSPGLLDL